MVVTKKGCEQKVVEWVGCSNGSRIEEKGVEKGGAWRGWALQWMGVTFTIHSKWNSLSGRGIPLCKVSFEQLA